MKYLGHKMSVSGCLDGVPAKVDHGYKDGGGLGTAGAKAVPGQQREGKACLTGNDADQYGNDAQKNVAAQCCQYDVLKIHSCRKPASGHHAGNDKYKSRPHNGKAEIGLALVQGYGAPGVFRVR